MSKATPESSGLNGHIGTCLFDVLSWFSRDIINLMADYSREPRFVKHGVNVNGFLCMAIDAQDRLWISDIHGIRVLSCLEGDCQTTIHLRKDHSPHCFAWHAQDEHMYYMVAGDNGRYLFHAEVTPQNAGTELVSTIISPAMLRHPMPVHLVNSMS